MNMEGPASQGTDGPVPFTPGPWKREGRLVYALHHNGDYQRGKPFLVNRFTAYVEACLSQGGTEAEANANAALIEAAPEMYKALDFVRRYDEMQKHRGRELLPSQLISAVTNALAKALNQPLTAR